MDASVFRDDSTKVGSIMNLLSQAHGMLGDVQTHLDDFSVRLRPEETQAAQTQVLELERVKQALLEREDELRALRGERIRLADDLQSIQAHLATAQQTIAELSESRKESETSLQTRCRGLEEEVRKITQQNSQYEKKLQRAQQQTEALLKTREGLLDLVKTREVSISPISVEQQNSAPLRLEDDIKI